MTELLSSLSKTHCCMLQSMSNISTKDVLMVFCVRRLPAVKKVGLKADGSVGVSHRGYGMWAIWSMHIAICTLSRTWKTSFFSADLRTGEKPTWLHVVLSNAQTHILTPTFPLLNISPILLSSCVTVLSFFQFWGVGGMLIHIESLFCSVSQSVHWAVGFMATEPLVNVVLNVSQRWVHCYLSDSFSSVIKPYIKEEKNQLTFHHFCFQWLHKEVLR